MREVDRVILMGEPHQEGHDEPADITIGYRQERMPPQKYDITNLMRIMTDLQILQLDIGTHASPE